MSSLRRVVGSFSGPLSSLRSRPLLFMCGCGLHFTLGRPLDPQPIDRLEKLRDLVRPRLAALTLLQIDPGIAGPRHPPHPVACSVLPRLPEERIRDPASIRVTDAPWTVAHLVDQLFDLRHGNMVS